MEPLSEAGRQRDRSRINELEAQADLDGVLIKYLRDDKIVDRSQIENLEAALVKSRLIGTAIGVIMTTRKLTSTAALELLKQTSQARNVRVRDLAEGVVLTGTLP